MLHCVSAACSALNAATPHMPCGRKLITGRCRSILLPAPESVQPTAVHWSRPPSVREQMQCYRYASNCLALRWYNRVELAVQELPGRSSISCRPQVSRMCPPAAAVTVILTARVVDPRASAEIAIRSIHGWRLAAVWRIRHGCNSQLLCCRTIITQVAV